MRMSAKTCLLVAVAALATVGELSDTGSLTLGGGEAHAVVGRPLTPMSYAGVARRTTRRTYRRGAYYGGAYYGGAYAGGAYAAGYAAGAVTALPGGCVRAPGTAVIYQCGTVRYQPYYEGPTLVYQVVP